MTDSRRLTTEGLLVTNLTGSRWLSFLRGFSSLAAFVADPIFHFFSFSNFEPIR